MGKMAAGCNFMINGRHESGTDLLIQLSARRHTRTFHRLSKNLTDFHSWRCFYPPWTFQLTTLAGVCAGTSLAAEVLQKFDLSVSAEESRPSVLIMCTSRRWDSSGQLKWGCYVTPVLCSGTDSLPSLLPCPEAVGRSDSARTYVSRQGRVWKYEHVLFKVPTCHQQADKGGGSVTAERIFNFIWMVLLP